MDNGIFKGRHLRLDAIVQPNALEENIRPSAICSLNTCLGKDNIVYGSTLT